MISLFAWLVSAGIDGVIVSSQSDYMVDKSGSSKLWDKLRCTEGDDDFKFWKGNFSNLNDDVANPVKELSSTTDKIDGDKHLLTKSGSKDVGSWRADKVGILDESLASKHVGQKVEVDTVLCISFCFVDRVWTGIFGKPIEWFKLTRSIEWSVIIEVATKAYGQLNDNNARNTIECAAHEKDEKMLITYRW
jgi:hypothetical protein